MKRTYGALALLTALALLPGNAEAKRYGGGSSGYVNTPFGTIPMGTMSQAGGNPFMASQMQQQQMMYQQQQMMMRQQQQYQQQQFGQVTLQPGTWITVRTNQPISTEHNQVGDAFTGTLEKPLVANGLVVARRGQTIAGRVEVVDRGGRVKGVSRLGITITEVALVDGRQIPVHTQLIERTAGSSNGRDAAAIGASAGMGAAIGAAADGGFGAGMGAIAGAAAATIGVLATRGHDTAVYPETMLTFRLMEPVTLQVDQSFQPVTQDAYESRMNYREPVQRQAGPPPAYYGYGGGYGYPYYAPYPYSYWGPSFFFYSGPRFYGRGYSYGYRSYGRGYHR
jgi:hypothetical protein